MRLQTRIQVRWKGMYLSVTELEPMMIEEELVQAFVRSKWVAMELRRKRTGSALVQVQALALRLVEQAAPALERGAIAD